MSALGNGPESLAALAGLTPEEEDWLRAAWIEQNPALFEAWAPAFPETQPSKER